MAIGKPRGNKRSSGGPCSSTVTTVVLVAVCVLGIWILFPNSTSSFSKTTSPIDDSSSTKLNRKIPVDVTQDTLIDLSNNSSVFEDIVGDLDAQLIVQDDDEPKAQNDVEPVQETDTNYKPDEDGDPVNDIATEDKEETASNVVDDDDDGDDSLNDSDVGKQEAEEEQEIELSASLLEDDNDNDGSEEITSSKDENKQKTQTIITDDQEDKQEKTNEEDIQDMEDNQEQEKTTENQQEQEQEEEQEQDDGPIESHSIAAETKAQVENREAREVSEKMEQAKIESIITNTTKPIKISNIANIHFIKGDIDESGDNLYEWGLCNETTGADYVPCLDNEIAIRNEHQERHCPNEAPVCLVPLSEGYKTPIPWPQSRDKIWLHNVPNKALSTLNGHKNMVKVTEEFITFPKSAHHYINFLQEIVPEIAWGKYTRVVLDVGCSVASFGGYLFDKDVVTISFASNDEQVAQMQLALERGIPAISTFMGTQRLPFSSRVFDLVHCVGCTVPWHKDGGILLLEVNRVLRPGGYFVWSSTAVYRSVEEDVQIWKEMSALTVAMCWELVTIKKDKMNGIGVAIYHKPDSNECYNARKKQHPPMCKPEDDPDSAWYVPLQTCMHEIPMGETERGSQWPEEWPDRIQKHPYWLNESHMGINEKPFPNDFRSDTEHWKRVINTSYMSNLGINWSNIHNVMDMRAVYGGFAAALKDMKLWVLNVVNIDSPDTLPIIFERGLIGIYHDWCESFNTYPRTYDLLHADYLISKLKNRCKIKGVIAEIDRILRPGGSLIARDESSMITELEKLLKSLHWEVNSTFINDQEGIICGQKSTWRPSTYVTPF